VNFGETPMNRIHKPQRSMALMGLIFAFSISSPSFAQDDGSQFADESYAEEDLEAQADHSDESHAADEMADGQTDDQTDDQSNESDNWAKESWDEPASEEDDDEML
jgi:hypothetical protein